MTERFAEWIVLGIVFAVASFFAAQAVVSNVVTPAMEQITAVLTQ